MGIQNKDNKKEIILSNLMDDNSDFIPIIADGRENHINNFNVPETLAILPLKNTVLFSGVLIPIAVGRKKSVRLVKYRLRL